MHELMFQAGVKGMSERGELIPCIYYSERSEVSTRDSEILWLQGICCEFEKSRSSTLQSLWHSRWQQHCQ